MLFANIDIWAVRGFVYKLYNTPGVWVVEKLLYALYKGIGGGLC